MTEITVTPADRAWLLEAAAILKGKKDASVNQRKAAARELHRLAYRAKVTEDVAATITSAIEADKREASE